MLEAAARRFGARVAIRWHAYELRPEPVPLPDPDSEYIREHWENRVLPMAAERGLVMRIPRTPVRSRRALQTALFAQDQETFLEMDRAIFRARFEDDLDIADLDVLKNLARGAGLDAEALAYAVTSNAYLDQVIADLRVASQLGINGVPCAFVGPSSEDFDAFLHHAEPVMGAVPYDHMETAIQRALSSGNRLP